MLEPSATAGERQQRIARRIAQCGCATPRCAVDDVLAATPVRGPAEMIGPSVGSCRGTATHELVFGTKMGSREGRIAL